MEKNGNFWKKMEIFVKNGKKWEFFKRNKVQKFVHFEKTKNFIRRIFLANFMKKY